MIDPKAVATYAQYNEDIILAALFADVKKGTYVDVGANYPVVDSVTKYFYDRGWRGVNIEPLQSLYQQLLEKRPEDKNICCGISDHAGKAVFREYPELHGHSTFSDAQKQEHGDEVAFREYEVEIRTLKELFTELKLKHIDFLKIDVEGYEYQVIAGNDWDVFRPEAICIEANHVGKDWRPILHRHGYKMFITDGLNEYYLAEESWSRTQSFAEDVIELDYHALKQHQYEAWANDTELLQKHVTLVKKQDEVVSDLKAKIHELERTSLKGKNWPTRLKIALKGLSIDWLRFVRSKN